MPRALSLSVGGNLGISTAAHAYLSPAPVENCPTNHSPFMPVLMAITLGPVCTYIIPIAARACTIGLHTLVRALLQYLRVNTV